MDKIAESVIVETDDSDTHTLKAISPRPSTANCIENADIKGRYWRIMFENLRRYIDEIYDICLEDKSIIECKEAILTLEIAARHFVQLMNFIEAEAKWQQEEQPTSISWEIRQTLLTPTKPLKLVEAFSPRTACRKIEDVEFNNDTDKQRMLNQTPVKANHVVLPRCKPQLNDSGVTVQTSSMPDQCQTSSNSEEAQDRIEVPEEIIEVQIHDQDDVRKAEDDDAGWTIVRHSKRRSSSTASEESFKLHGDQQQSQSLVPLQRRPFPKNAAEIPHTKNSLAKMEYNRQYIMRRQQEREQQQRLLNWKNDRPQRISPKRGLSLPSSLNDVGIRQLRQLCAEGPPKHGTHASMMLSRLTGRGRFKSYQSTESLCSLQSIREDDGDEMNFIEQTPETEADALKRNEIDWSRLKNGVISLQPIFLPTSGFLERADIEYDGNSGSLSPPFDIESEEKLHSLAEEERSLAEEEELLQREIEEEERKSIDAEVQAASVRELQEAKVDHTECQQEAEDSKVTHNGDLRRLDPEAKVETAEEKKRRGQEAFQQLQAQLAAEQCKKWSEWVEMAESEMLQCRQIMPIQTHEKLSSPSRKRPLEDRIKAADERCAKADDLRRRLLEFKSQRLHDLLRRVQEVRAQKERVLEEKRQLTAARMAKAEENRIHMLQARVKKAHDEEDKVHEISFINKLVDECKRHDVLNKHQEQQARLHCLQEERQKKLDAKAARDAAAEERRRTLDAQKQARLCELTEKRRKRAMIIEQQKETSERERQQHAMEKTRERQQRLAELEQQNQCKSEALQQKINDKHERSQKRHEENIELIKQKASEMCTPKSVGNTPVSTPTTETAKSIFGVSGAIPSEVHLISHLKGRRHVENVKENAFENSMNEVTDAPKHLVIAAREFQFDGLEDLQKLRKRKQQARKKLQLKAEQYLNSNCRLQLATESPNQAKLKRLVTDWKALVESNTLSKPWLDPDITTFERCLSGLTNALTNSADADVFYSLGGFETLLTVSQSIIANKENVRPLPLKCFLRLTGMFSLLISKSSLLAMELLYISELISWFDIVHSQMLVLSADLKFVEKGDSKIVKKEVIATVAIRAAVHVLELIGAQVKTTGMDSCPIGKDGFITRLRGLLSYLCNTLSFAQQASKLLMQMQACCDDAGQMSLLQSIFDLMKCVVRLVQLCEFENGNQLQLMTALQTTRLMNSVSLMYNLLLSPSSTVADRKSPVILNENSLKLIESILVFLVDLAILNRGIFQTVLSDEGTSLEFRHVLSLLLQYCVKNDQTKIVNVVIVLIGHFALLNSANQALISSGSQPSILQQLCLLPFGYFSDPLLTFILFPTLISSVFQNQINRRILEQELNSKTLANFISNQMELKGNSDRNANDDQFLFSNRFPKEKWSEAKIYFETAEI